MVEWMVGWFYWLNVVLPSEWMDEGIGGWMCGWKDAWLGGWMSVWMCG